MHAVEAVVGLSNRMHRCREPGCPELTTSSRYLAACPEMLIIEVNHLMLRAGDTKNHVVQVLLVNNVTPPRLIHFPIIDEANTGAQANAEYELFVCITHHGDTSTGTTPQLWTCNKVSMTSDPIGTKTGLLPLTTPDRFWWFCSTSVQLPTHHTSCAGVHASPKQPRCRGHSSQARARRGFSAGDGRGRMKLVTKQH